jgi:hypothetical protein
MGLKRQKMDKILENIGRIFIGFCVLFTIGVLIGAIEVK